jgi:hypothetical protein
MANMDELSFKDMCKDNMNMLYEGFDYLTNGWWETSLKFRGASLLK